MDSAVIRIDASMIIKKQLNNTDNRITTHENVAIAGTVEIAVSAIIITVAAAAVVVVMGHRMVVVLTTVRLRHRLHPRQVGILRQVIGIVPIDLDEGQGRLWFSVYISSIDAGRRKRGEFTYEKCVVVLSLFCSMSFVPLIIDFVFESLVVRSHVHRKKTIHCVLCL